MLIIAILRSLSCVSLTAFPRAAVVELLGSSGDTALAVTGFLRWHVGIWV